jgi:TolA-binding protein
MLFGLAFAPACAEVPEVDGDGPLAALEKSYSKLEEAVARMTGEMEEGARANKKAAADAVAAIADMRLRLDELGSDMDKKFAAHDAELGILKMALNSLAMERVASPLAVSAKPAAPPAGLIVVPLSEPAGTPAAEEELLVARPAPAPSSPMPAVSDAGGDEAFKGALALFAEGKHKEASEGFAANMRRFPEGPRFFDNLLYLGRSLQGLGKPEDACRAFAVIRESDDAGATAEIKAAAATAYGDFGCL